MKIIFPFYTTFEKKSEFSLFFDFVNAFIFFAEADTGYRSPSLRECSLVVGGVSYW